MPTTVVRTLRAAFKFPVLGSLLKWLVPLTLYASLAVYVDREWASVSDLLPPKEASVAVLTGIIFGWLMSFRANAAYARWWEGRTLWGQLVNDSRNLSLKGSRLLAPNPASVQHLTERIGAFAEALLVHLRTPPLRAPQPAPPHLPLQISGDLFSLLYAAKAAGHIDPWEFLTLDEHVKKLMDICGGCERIKNTPLTASYRGLLRKGIGAYLLTLPWFMVNDVGWLTVPVVAVIGYALLGLELIAESIENPFGLDGDDLPLEDLVATIRRSVAAAASGACAPSQIGR